MCLVMFRVNCRFGSNLEPKDTYVSSEESKQRLLSQMTLVLVGKQRGMLISGSTYSIPAPPSSPSSSLPPLSVPGWLPLQRRQKPGALTSARLWALSSPPGGLLGSVLADRSAPCFVFCGPRRVWLNGAFSSPWGLPPLPLLTHSSSHLWVTAASPLQSAGYATVCRLLPDLKFQPHFIFFPSRG